MAADPTVKAHGQNPLTPKFDDLVVQALDLWKVAGLSIAVVDGPRTFMKGYGIATLPDTPVTPETLFYTASTTKAFCAAAASLLVDDDEKHKDFQWTTPISHLTRDDFVLQDTYWTEHITVEDALCHRTGMPRHDKCCIGTGGSVRETVRKLRHLPTSREPRTVSQYCNIMYVAVSHAIEVVTGQHLGDFLAHRIWQPLGMTSTYFSLSDAEKSGKPFAQGYFWDEEKKEQVLLPRMDFPGNSGAGNNISNVLDYTKWVRAMIDMGGPMSQKGHEALVKPLIAFNYGNPASFPTVFYGLGWFMLWYEGEKVLFHPGDLYGHSAIVVYLPQRLWGCVMMGNSSLAPAALQKLTWYLIDELLEVPESRRVDWEERSKQSKQKQEEQSVNARERLYPEAATSIAASLPLHAYAGTYSHPAYPTIDLVVKDGALYGDVSDRPWPFALDFEHVSGEHFIVRTVQVDNVDDKPVKAEFSVDARGKAEKLRLGFEEETEMIEFARVVDSK